MKYLATLLVAMGLLFQAGLVNAAPKAQDKSTQTANLSEKDKLIGNLNNMRNQEVRVIILQQLINEEVAKLNQVQENFCKTYKLDVEKLRQGLYRYDDDKGKFVEMKVEQKPQ